MYIYLLASSLQDGKCARPRQICNLRFPKVGGCFEPAALSSDVSSTVFKQCWPCRGIIW
jgi:hypothetical protein